MHKPKTHPINATPYRRPFYFKGFWVLESRHLRSALIEFWIVLELTLEIVDGGFGLVAMESN